MLSLGRDYRGYQYRKNFDVRDIKRALIYSQGLIEGTVAWTTTFCENHDSARSISRFTTRDPQYRTACGKLLATLTATLSGTLFLYQGQEIGMTNIPRDWAPEEYKDVEAQNFLAKIQREFPGDEEMWKKAMDGLNQFGRDNARTPVQWDETRHAGFTSGNKPWMRVNENYKEGVNVKAQKIDERSVLTYWKRMLALRKRFEDLFVFGKFLCVDEGNEKTFTFWKCARTGSLRAYVVLNFTDECAEFEKPKGLQFLIGNERKGDMDIEGTVGILAPWEARIYISGHDRA